MKVMIEGLLPENGDTLRKPSPTPNEISMIEIAAATAAPPSAAVQEMPARAVAGHVSGSSRVPRVSRISGSVVTDMP
ncbi:MAG TPA: hypothetical protein VJK90_04775 [Acetobacteraceae bacterium]|nr:hypothetical protein [Acetobacteraceae bacterium]